MSKSINKKTHKKGIIIAASIIIGILLTVGVVSYIYVDNMMNKINYEQPNEEIDDPQNTADPNELIDPENIITEPNQTPQPNLPVEQPTTIRENTKDIQNILLIGVDRRNSSWNGNSDSMVILTLNKATKEVKLSSIMRDSYVYVPNKGFSKINYAYAVQGPNLLMDTIKHNFGIKIDNYVCVDFNAFKNIVDVIGGISVNLSADEIAVFKNTKGKFAAGAGTYSLTSQEALTYVQNRSVGRWDFDRTMRQRKVLSILFDEFKGKDIFALNNVLSSTLPYVKTNFTKTELLSFVLLANGFKGSKVQEFRIPMDGSYTTSVANNYIMIMDMEKNTRELQKFIFG